MSEFEAGAIYFVDIATMKIYACIYADEPINPKDKECL